MTCRILFAFLPRAFYGVIPSQYFPPAGYSDDSLALYALRQQVFSCPRAVELSTPAIFAFMLEYLEWYCIK